MAAVLDFLILQDKCNIRTFSLNKKTYLHSAKQTVLSVSKACKNKYMYFPAMSAYCIFIIQITLLLLLGLCLYQSSPISYN